MLKKQNRLKDFKLASFRQIKSSSFSLKVGKNTKELNRFAFVVTKRIDKRAAMRNRLKRVVRSCIEEIFDKIEKGQDFIIYPKKEAAQATRAQILEEMKNLFIKQKLLK